MITVGWCSAALVPSTAIRALAWKCDIILQRLETCENLRLLLGWSVCMQLNACSLFAPFLTCTLKAVKNMVAMVSALSPASTPCCSPAFPSAAVFHTHRMPTGKRPCLFSRCSALACVKRRESNTCCTVLFTGLFGFLFLFFPLPVPAGRS